MVGPRDEEVRKAIAALITDLHTLSGESQLINNPELEELLFRTKSMHARVVGIAQSSGVPLPSDQSHVDRSKPKKPAGTSPRLMNALKTLMTLGDK
jgi:hypothetical protein